MNEITFIEIVQMIGEGKVPAGAVFHTPALLGSEDTVQATHDSGGLKWAEGDMDRVQLHSEVINDKWWIEIPEIELTWQEAFTELAAGNEVEAERWGTTYILSPTVDFGDLWEYSPFSDLGELLNHTKYFKVTDS